MINPLNLVLNTCSFGALTSAILLYGFSLIYGFTGKTGLYDLSQYFGSFNIVAIGITFLVLAGLAFKVSLFPFHFWAPDVYEGAPTPVAGFLSTASKAAGFAVLIRLFSAVFPAIHADWSLILAVLSVLTMTVGNLVALTQKSIKRMLAYSSIAHAGYAMIGVVAYSQFRNIAWRIFPRIRPGERGLLPDRLHVDQPSRFWPGRNCRPFHRLGRNLQLQWPFPAQCRIGPGCPCWLPFIGWHAPICWICVQILCFCSCGPFGLDLVSHHRRDQLHRRSLLLPECPQGHLSLPDGKRRGRPAPDPSVSSCINCFGRASWWDITPWNSFWTLVQACHPGCSKSVLDAVKSL